MRAVAQKLEGLSGERLVPGRLQGLLFRDTQRFITDLAMELRLKASYGDFIAASQGGRDAPGVP